MIPFIILSLIMIKSNNRKKSVLIILILLLVNALFFAYTGDISVAELKGKYANDESKFIEIDGMQVHYRDEGEGIPIVLIHGTASSLHTWDAWTNSLKNDYRVIRLDMPAFGLTGPHPNQDYSIKTYSGLLDTFLSRLSIDSAYLVGNSLGGGIAWHYTAEHPTKVKKLVLIDPTGYPRNGEPWIFKLARTPVLNAIIKYFTPKSLVEDNLKQVFFNDNKITPELIDRYYDLTLREGNRTAFIDRAKTKMIDQTEKLKSIHTPTLIIWGKEDSWIPVSDGQRFLNDMPNAKIAVLENTGHVPMEESPKQSLTPLLEFLE